MKISHMTVDQATDALVKIAEPLGRLCEDKELTAALKDMYNLDEMSLLEAIGKMLPRFVNLCLVNHKHDLYAITSALLLIPLDDVGKQSMGDTLKGLQDSIDEDLIGFFTRFVTAAKKPGKK